MQVNMGLAPVREELPDQPGYFVEFRKMKRGERNRYNRLWRKARSWRELTGQEQEAYRAGELELPVVNDEAHDESLDYLLQCSIVTFRLPGAQSEILSAPDDRAHNARIIDEFDEQLEDWAVLKALQANNLLTAQAEELEETEGNSDSSQPPSGGSEPTTPSD